MRKKLSFISVGLVVLMFIVSGIAQADLQIVINIPTFTLYLYEQGVQVRSYPISIGTELNPSVLGETTIINKVIDPTYYPINAAARGLAPIPPGPENPVGTRWLGLGFPSYGIHGTNNPKSIGSAASSGCIRMLNDDVEELTDLVKVGTPVQIVYQTVLIQEDPLLHTRTITVFPDVYKQGVTPSQLQRELDHYQWGEVFWPALITLLRTPTGKPSPLPWSVPLRFNSEPTSMLAVQWGEKYYVPFDLPLDLRLNFINDVVQWGDKYFLPLDEYLELTGLNYKKAQGDLNLYSPQAYIEEISLGNALIYHDEIYVAAQVLIDNLIPEQVTVLPFLGEIYFPLSFVKRALFKGEDQHAEVRLEWSDLIETSF